MWRSYAQLGSLWQQLCTKSGPTQDTTQGTLLNTKRHRCQKSGKYQWKRAFWRFRIGPVMFSCWAHVEAQLGPKLNGSNLEPSCAQIEAKWIQVGPCWRELAPSWAHVADMRGPNGEFGRCCSEMRNVQITTARKSAPPSADALPLNRGLFELIGFAPKLWRADS